MQPSNLEPSDFLSSHSAANCPPILRPTVQVQAILTNPEVIAVDQAGVLLQQTVGGTLPRWRKQLPTGEWVVAVYNLGGSPANITVLWSDFGASGAKRVRDFAARADLGTFSGSWTATNVPAHGSRLIKLS